MSTATTVMRAAQRAEWHRARLALVCEPAIETLFAVLNTDAANFLRPFDPAAARVEHEAMRAALERRGARVVDVREVLTHADPCLLRDAARHALVYEPSSDVGTGDRAKLDSLHDATIDALGPGALVDVVMLRPIVRVRPNQAALDPTSRFVASFEVRPVDNAYFMRDPLLTTAAGVVVGRHRLDVRKSENDLAALVLAQLGIVPVLRVQAPGHVEGGDFLPAGSFCLQGQGLLSDADGVGQLLDAGAYGDVEVGVVRDPRAQMDEMHLDTYFALYGPHLAGICDDRLGADQPSVDVWVPEETAAGKRYRRTNTVPFLAYLDEKHVEVLTFSKEEQDDFAANGLLAGPMDYLAVAQAGEDFVHRLRARGVHVEPLDFSALTGGYGGPHCSTQVLLRSEEELT